MSRRFRAGATNERTRLTGRRAGIVAWTISIEVAQQGDRTAGNGRRTQHSQPTSRAAPPPQFLAFRRPSSAQADEKLASARTSAKERNRTSDNQEPEQAGVVGAPEGRIAVSARSRAEPSSTTSWPTPAGSEKSSESEPERDEESILAADEAPGNGKRETSSSDLPAQLKPAERARLEDDSERASQDASSSKPDKLVSLLLTVSSFSFILNHSLMQFLSASFFSFWQASRKALPSLCGASRANTSKSSTGI